MNPTARPEGDAWQPDYRPAIVDQVLPPAMCERVIEMAASAGFERSAVYGHQGPVDSPDYRNSAAANILPEDFGDLYGQITTTLQHINAERFRFAIYGLSPIQVIRYEPGCFFREHVDIGNSHAAHRKISLIVQLSDPGQYTGGSIVLGGGQIVVPRERGGGCFFPSWVSHRVDAVETGVRYSLVTWGKGDYFR